MNIKQATKITGKVPRKVHYCVWNDGTKSGTRNVCSLYHVVECKTKEEATQKAMEYYKSGRKVVSRPSCMYYEYYQKKGLFVPTVFVYPSSWSKNIFGYFVNRWALTYKSGISDISGKLNCNVYCIYELDSDKLINETWLCEEIEKITE